jgi:hypothetical protein
MRSLLRPALGLAFSLGVLLPGCSSDPSPQTSPAPSSCKDDGASAGFDPQNPKVQFARDVLPIFDQSCGFSSCHGARSGDANGVYLGTDAARVYTGLVGVKASELPSMSFVAAGNPQTSYLMRKMDGTQCALDAQCTGKTCQSSMPKGDLALPAQTRDVVRRWIAQGARND